MRLTHFILLLLTLVLAVSAWDKDDYEIFDLVSDLEAAEGKGTNFYSHLNISPSATLNELNKAYRKKSLELHPDKNPGVKNIQERFARLGVISQILRSPERRERYNHFYKNGVPKWRGTGYYYSRYRPTLTHTLVFLVFLTSLFHLLVQKMNYNKDAKRVAYFSRAALNAAASGQGKREKIDGEESARRVRVPMVEGSDTGGYLELVVIGEHVYLPHDDGSLDPLSGLAINPSYFRTWPFKLALTLLRRLTAALPPSTHASLPVSIRPHAIEPAAPVEDEPAGYEVKPRRKNRRGDRSGTNTPRDTPRDSPVTTELESAGEDETADGETEGENGEKKPKKRGPGKAGAARRRRMGLKK